MVRQVECDFRRYSLRLPQISFILKYWKKVSNRNDVLNRVTQTTYIEKIHRRSHCNRIYVLY